MVVNNLRGFTSHIVSDLQERKFKFLVYSLTMYIIFIVCYVVLGDQHTFC